MVWGGRKSRADLELGGRYGLWKAKMSREGGNATTNATKSPSLCRIVLPVQNRPPDLRLRP